MVLECKDTYLDLFIEVTTAITSTLNLDEVFKMITQKIPEILSVDAATIRLRDASGSCGCSRQRSDIFPTPILTLSSPWRNRVVLPSNGPLTMQKLKIPKRS